jgi:hypothetical protein
MMAMRLIFRSTVHGSSGVTHTLPWYVDGFANFVTHIVWGMPVCLDTFYATSCTGPVLGYACFCHHLYLYGAVRRP